MKITKIKSLCLLLLAFSFLPAYAALYRWTDSNGKIHYSDKVPPDYSQIGHTELNQNGMTKNVVLSAKQRKALKAAEEKSKIDEVERLAKEKQMALDEMRDIQLLNMFTNKEELIKVYKSKLEMTDESINLLKARHKYQSKKLETLENRYENIKNPQTRESYQKKIDILLDNLTVYQQAITENYVEKEKINAEFKVNMQRFTELLAERGKN